MNAKGNCFFVDTEICNLKYKVEVFKTFQIENILHSKLILHSKQFVLALTEIFEYCSDHSGNLSQKCYCFEFRTNFSSSWNISGIVGKVQVKSEHNFRFLGILNRKCFGYPQ